MGDSLSKSLSKLRSNGIEDCLLEQIHDNTILTIKNNLFDHLPCIPTQKMLHLLCFGYLRKNDVSYPDDLAMILLQYVSNNTFTVTFKIPHRIQRSSKYKVRSKEGFNKCHEVEASLFKIIPSKAFWKAKLLKPQCNSVDTNYMLDKTFQFGIIQVPRRAYNNFACIKSKHYPGIRDRDLDLQAFVYTKIEMSHLIILDH